MIKSDLRKKYRLLRKKLSIQEVEDRSIAIANQLLQLSILDKTYYHLFLSITEQKEVETSFILSILQGKDKEVVVSKSNFEEGILTHYLLTENTRIAKNKYNIPEPIDGLEVPEQKIDVVFIPLLAFDENGNRVGYGKGFYDNFLKRCRNDVVKVGLSLFEAEKGTITDIYEGDVKLNYCVTPTKAYSFS